MAVSLVHRYISTGFKKFCTVWNGLQRMKSSAHVVMSDDSATIVCWHPETQFPYEKTLPLPEKITKKNDSVLKVQTSKEFLEMLKPKSKELVEKELCSLTFTTKHIWGQKPKRYFRKKILTDRDRPYL